MGLALAPHPKREKKAYERASFSMQKKKGGNSRLVTEVTGIYD